MSEINTSVQSDAQENFENSDQLQLPLNGQQLDFLDQLSKETHQTLTTDNNETPDSQQKQ